MALSEADHLTEPTACSSSLKMQEPTCNFPPEKDEERPEAESLSRVELEQAQHEPEDSISTCDPWPLPAEDSLCFPPCLEEQPQDTEAAPRPLWGSLSNKHHENQGNLLQFDRQALGRISTSPTLRRLRGRGWRTWPSPPQEDALETHTDGSCGGPTDNLPKSLPGNPKDSPKLTSPLTPGTSLPSSMQKAFNTAHSLEPPAKPSDECALPMLQIIHEGPLPQASLLTSRHPDPQGTQVEKHRSRRPQPQRDLPDPAKLSRSSVLPPESASLESVLFPASNPAAGTLPDTYGSSVIKKGESEVDWFYEHRRSSMVLNLPGLEVFPGDLLVSDGAADYLCHPLLLLNSESKKPRWPFSKRGVGKDRHKHILDLESCLSSMKTADSRDYEFCGLKDKTWNEVMETHQNLPNDQSDLRKQQEAVWELFTSECTYFLDHLLVLKMVFMNTLKYLQIHEYLLDVNLWRLFANLEELTQTSLGFANSLFGVFKDYIDASETTPPMDFVSVLTKCFRGRLCPSHQTYCLNYSAAVFYLERLRHRDDFSIYLKWCEQNEHCRRLHLTELLVAPLHRLTRYPLLLKNIWKRSTDPTEKIMIYSIKEKVEKSIRDLEGKVKWLDNYQKFKHLQDIIVWPPLWERDKRFFIPECLKHIFKEHMAETILSPTSRHLIYEGKLTLAESTRFLDVYLFLFDDFLLVTKPKRNKKKLGGLDTGLVCPSLTPELQTVVKEGVSCTVLDQPIPLDRLVVKSIDPLHMSVFGLRNAFLIQHENRYHQCVAAFLLQAQTENIKKMWMAQITAAISCFTKSQETTKVSLFTLPSESSEI